MTLTDSSSQGFVTLKDSTGTEYTYVKQASSSDYVGVGDASDGSVLRKSTTIHNPVDATDATNYTGWQLSELDGTITTWTLLSGSTWVAKWVDEPGSEAETTYLRDGNGRITRILAPVPAAVTCPAPPTALVTGCQALNITYASTTTATGTGSANWGDYTGLVSSITYTAYNPATSAMATTAVASYLYDNTGHLRAKWDPRVSPALKTTYTYNGAGRLDTITPPGRAAWTLTYDSSGRIAAASRTDPVNGTARQAVVYDLPITGSGAPVDLSASQTQTWAQSLDLPYVGAAVFPASRTISTGTVNGVTGVNTPSTGDWPYADLTYLDVNGRVVNTASYGAGAWQIDSTRYDPYNNVVWQLDARNRAHALAPTIDTDPYTAGVAASADRADLLATVSTYTTDGVDQLTELGPAHEAWLADGTPSSLRAKTTYTYDEGAPSTGGPYRLVTTTTTSAEPVDGAATTTADSTMTQTGYDPIDGASTTGPTSGWVLRAATTQRTVMGTSTSSNDIITRTRYDSAGRVVESRMPTSSAGTDAGTTQTTYYTADTAASVATCRSKPAWAGAVCQTGPAAQPSGTTIPTDVTTYTYWGATDTVVETSGTTTRTTTTTYDAAGRPTGSSLVVSPTGDGGTTVPSSTITYDSSTGDLTSTTAGGSTISSGYDTLGQQTSYTDADGATTTTTYTIDGQPATRSDGKGTYAYTYDGTDAAGNTEHRGLLTGLDIDIPGGDDQFTAAYDEAGQQVLKTYPNAITATTQYDNTGHERNLSYYHDGWFWTAFQAQYDANDRTSWNAGGLDTQFYTYDNNDRLTKVTDSTEGQCTTRSYAFDKNGNRTTLTTAAPNTDGTCQTSTTSTVNSTYDTADRATDTGYTYDKFGRTLTLPASTVTGGSALSVGYNADDMVATLTQGTKSKSFTLDPARRPRQTTDKTSGTETRRILNHYADTGDSPAWIATSTNAGSTWTWERNLIGIDGDLVGTQPDTGIATIYLTNLHGDVIADTDDSPWITTVNNYYTQTEYGLPEATNTTNPTRYGWLGAKQRSTDTLASLTLMGVRLYNPTTGRFLQTDPVPGGNENTYNYPNNPIDKYDLDGRLFFKKWRQRVARNVYWRLAFHASMTTLYAYGAVSSGYQVKNVYRGYKEYRNVRRLGYKAYFRPIRKRHWTRKGLADAALALSGVRDIAHQARATWKANRDVDMSARRWFGGFVNRMNRGYV